MGFDKYRRNLRTGSLNPITIPSLAADASCADAYFEVDVTQTSATYNTTWTLGNLAAGGSTNCKVTVKVASALPDGTTSLTNYARMSATAFEVNVPNNEVSDIDQVSAHPDLTIAKT